MTEDICARLAAPFDPAIVSWRIGPTTKDKKKGMALAYIDARDVMRRLDEVCGPENWQDEYPWSDGKRVVCRIGVRVNGEWVWKTDGAGDTDTEGEKGALSDAFKRAAVKWGIGRYLYDVDSPWVEIEQRGNGYVIPDSERTKLAGVLRRLAGTQSAPPATHRPKNEQAPPARSTAPVAQPAEGTKAADPERVKRVNGARERRDRIHTALENAKTPKLIDEIIDINSQDLTFIKDVHEPAYAALMQLAAARKTELLAAA